jgi:hypothetical protein
MGYMGSISTTKSDAINLSGNASQGNHYSQRAGKARSVKS